MAWRSSGTNNESMVDNLKRFGVVRTTPVEESFRAVDRRFFVPQNQLSLAHADQPLRDHNVHISAPHIYGTVMEALELDPNSSQSFLNLGSGTGYLSCMVASLLGPAAVHVAVEVSRETIQHAEQSIQRWKDAAGGTTAIPPIEMIHGNALQIDATRGEGATGFDRIYLGAAVERRHLPQIAALLRPGGILVGPVDEDLVKVVRVGEGSVTHPTPSRVPRTLRGQPPMLSNDFAVQVLSGVRFAAMVESPSIPTVLPSRIWDSSQHHRYPDSFKQGAKEIMLCAHSNVVQAVPPVPRERVNAAAILPRAVWLQVLTYTTRDWFDKPRQTEDVLRRRLAQQQEALRAAEDARRQAEERLASVEHERNLYKLLALRWSSRLRAAGATEDDLLRGPARYDVRILDAATRNFLRVNRVLGGRFGLFDEDDDDSDAEDVHEEEGANEHAGDGDHEDEELPDEESTTESETEVAMEDANEVAMDEEAVAFSAPMVRSQVRAVSIAGDDF